MVITMDKTNKKPETGCCPRFDPKPWENKEIRWEGKPFIKDHIRCIFHIPINFGKVITKNMKKIKNADAMPPFPVILSNEKSAWSSDIYIAVTKEVPETEIVKVAGTFLTKVFEGSYNNIGKWSKEMESYVKSKKKDIKKMYFFYTTCPKCAKYYGKNYTVILAQI